MADECPGNMQAEEMGPERWSGKPKPPPLEPGQTTPIPLITTKPPSYFVEQVDAGRGKHLCKWAKGLLEKLNNQTQPVA